MCLKGPPHENLFSGITLGSLGDGHSEFRGRTLLSPKSLHRRPSVILQHFYLLFKPRHSSLIRKGRQIQKTSFNLGMEKNNLGKSGYPEAITKIADIVNDIF